jgi:hypothetical protein
MGHVPEFDAEEGIPNRDKISNESRNYFVKMLKCQNSNFDCSEG